ncbi:MAG: response regulator [Pseudogulbenkiania sp.]|nr:response regulator [Pseudogulbenkiania sp.]
MIKSTPPSATILIASDSASDAMLVQKLLHPEFDHIFISTDSNRAVEDFERYCPDVLVLAFNGLEKSERHYLGLYRLSGKIHLQPHRTVILCSNDEVRRAYELCRKELFDDYVLFWPMTHDAPRLPMSVHNALRELAALRSGAPSAAEFAAQARHLSELESLLEQQVAKGGERIATAGRAVAQAELDIGAALDGALRRFAQGGSSGARDSKELEGLAQEFDLLKKGVVSQRFRTVAESVQPVKQWAEEFRLECAPHLESARVLSEMAGRIRSTVLVVDDDEFLRKMVGKILESENYQLVFAASGLEAFNVLRKTRPNLILMDIMMPDIDGIEVLRRLKSIPELAKVPVIMLTGKAEGAVVIESLKAGACDFVVKPFDRNILIAKVAGLL